MFTTKNTTAVFLAITTCWCLPAVSAPKMYQPLCLSGPDGNCAPRRITYGYYPTTWRRWPTEGPTVAPRPEPEQVPTPAAKEELPNIEPEVPSTVVDEAPLTPAEKEPTLPAPKEESPLTPSFEDTPPEPPKDLRDEPQMPDDVNKDEAAPQLDERRRSPSPTKLPGLDADEPPSMPDSDPFRDDPTEEAKPADPPRRGAAKRSPLRWESTKTSRTQRVGELSVAREHRDQADIPAVLEPLEAGVNGPGKLVPIHTAAPNSVLPKGNPLRTETAEPRTGQVVPTANWSSAQAMSHGSVESPRRNPLREN